MKTPAFLYIGIFFIRIATLNAQIPTGVPGPEDNTKLDLTSLADILIYIVLPIIILLLLLFRHKQNKKK